MVIVNETLARKHWPGRDPIGKRIRFYGAPDRNPWMEIVGVVEDVTHELNLAVTPEYYLPFAQDTWSAMTLGGRTTSIPPRSPQQSDRRYGPLIRTSRYTTFSRCMTCGPWLRRCTRFRL